ncbi:benzoate carboxyl methyltransferase [Phtheirospermum japonicum]|uniref:Benzoate carboxyl methyltransferase n=1 Tax=Phtheirospermum japonicum TaxID=374723 RepID=A0A830CTP0_9LAMI|nr:benzoate carboxyl methyltransferase [Phtheirospermum japonicum]
MRIADLGCASGPNTLFAVSHIIDTMQNLCMQHNNNNLPSELEVFLNDLPENDFNSLFSKFLPSFITTNGNGRKRLLECFVYGVPGSFYGKLFPSNSLQFAYSSTSVHWLSKIPEGVEKNNKQKIHITTTSPPQVCAAYAQQFQRDFFRFLSSRAEEMTNGGRMVLAFHGRSVTEPCSNDGLELLTILSQTISDMVALGLVKEDDLDSFNVPMYAPFQHEIEDIITSEESFSLDKMESFYVPWVADYDKLDDGMVSNNCKSGKLVASSVRAYMEPIIVGHFGSSINVDGVFEVYAKKMAEHYSKHRSSSYFIRVISLTKKLKE